MSVLVYIENTGGSIKKSSLEAITYAAQIATKAGTDCIGVATGEADFSGLGSYGLQKVLVDKGSHFEHFDARAYTKLIAFAAGHCGADIIVLSNGMRGKAIAAALSVKLEAGLVTGAIALPDTSNGFSVKKSVYAGKAFANVQINTPIKIITLTPNSMQAEPMEAQAAVEEIDAGLTGDDIKVKLISTESSSDSIPLAEAELVVSGGRGLKGPENWHLVEDLADSIQAAVACSRPVADAGWRPHHEHVGQTGGTIRPNLYIAIGISGAIQHLAGVNQSKTIVVINKDPEAPFFKAADYGIVGDAFEVVPKLIDAARNLD